MAGILQPKEISVKIYFWNREKGHADQDCSSEDWEKDWRFDIQREKRWNWGKTKRFIQTWKQIGKEDFINTGFYQGFKDYSSQ
ncbi:MAG: hypothetical protein EZS28_042109 [Streblomastix strix]|uniref:Uncharacterized protein n=1 Tax=Streblomastix strix TaxID=222440 RepID=A0A5J4TVR8_9EUKA|nr:MAG: hypothetical protein EZS28_042109 [Streblomastix strix]